MDKYVFLGMVFSVPSCVTLVTNPILQLNASALVIEFLEVCVLLMMTEFIFVTSYCAVKDGSL